MYGFLVELLQPYLLVYLLTGLAVLNLWRRRRETRRALTLLAVPLVTLTALSTPAVGHLALGTLEWQYAPVDRRPDDARAIVVLGSGVVPPDPTRERGDLDEDTLRRCLHAAALYHQGQPCRVLVSGGKVEPESPAPACARLMRDFLLRLGVKASDLVVEDSSRTTYENAVECRKLLEGEGIDRVVLVTDAVDMFRAVCCFRKQGVEVIPSACNYRASHFQWSFFAFMPSPDAARACQRVWHEWLGAAWYVLRGRV